MSDRPSFELPDWFDRFEKLDKTSQLAWDERVRRISIGSASTEDHATQEVARIALEAGRPLPREARTMPGRELEPHERPFRSDLPDESERLARLGIPPLIADRVARKDGFATRSTRACGRVGLDYLVLVLLGVPGCGKTYAASQWLAHGKHIPPKAFARSKIRPRRFIEAPLLADIPFEERTAIGDSVALVVDEMGGEKDFLINDLTQLLVNRYKNALETVVTSNLSEPEFIDRYGVRFADRMREVGKIVTVAVDASESLRGRTP